MADNVGYTPGSGAQVATDDIGGVQHQRIKMVLGDDGVSAGDVSANNPMPITTKTGGIDDNFVLLRRLFKLMESQSATDGNQRQRVVVDTISAGTITTVSTVTTVTTVAAVTGITNALPAGTNTIGNVTVGGADQRQFIDIAKAAYALNIRSRLTFS